MSVKPWIVLKFGGSVLTDGASMGQAVHEIHRWRREGFAVVAVVSALAGKTDRLLADCHRRAAEPSAFALAEMLAGGERESASLLNLLLDRGGIPSVVLTPEALGLVAVGEPLDSSPVGLETAPFSGARDRDRVAVVPGFYGCNGEGQTVLFGRGGSDLTALFLASELGAKGCRLIKDQPALFAWDPKKPGPKPPRFGAVTWKRALETDGTVLQLKAVRLAQSRGQAFEVAGVGEVNGTRVGASETVEVSEPASFAPLRVAILGFGTVGAGVYSLLQAHAGAFEVRRILVRDALRPRTGGAPKELFTTESEGLWGGVDIVVEALGGTQPASDLITSALKAGCHVVTANKAVLAEHGVYLSRLAEWGGLQLLGSAAVGGNMPLLEQLDRLPQKPKRLRAVLSGTVAFLLDGLGRGGQMDALVSEAQRLGYAEADPSRDLSGLDVADKLQVLAQCLGGKLGAVEVEPLQADTGARARAARAQGRRLVQVATLERSGGVLSAKVALESLVPGDSLAQLGPDLGACRLDFEGRAGAVCAGKGAGRWPTSESVLGDLLELRRQAQSGLLQQAFQLLPLNRPEVR